MSSRFRSVSTGLLALVVLAAVPAAANAFLFPIAGASGSHLRVAQAARLADGGAIVVGSMRGRLMVIRLTSSGEVNPVYGGGDGIDLLQLDRGRGAATRGTAVAVDPRTGAAWVGVALGRDGRGAVVALDGRGGVVRRFGRRGVAGLGALRDPSAVAVGPARVLVAAGRSPCPGCRLVALGRRAGARKGSGVAAPVAGPPGRCPRAAVGSLALSGRLLLGGTGGACRTRLALADPTLSRGGHTLGLGAATRIAVAPASGFLGACVGVQRARTMGLARFDAGALPPGNGSARLAEITAARHGRSLVAVAPVAGRGCAALLRSRRGARVVQVVRGSAGARDTALPGGFHAAALFFCRRHVQVIGVRGTQAVIAVVPARR